VILILIVKKFLYTQRAIMLGFCYASFLVLVAIVIAVLVVVAI